jgi:drug/metabolite transporter superfamily protein YnfA
MGSDYIANPEDGAASSTISMTTKEAPDEIGEGSSAVEWTPANIILTIVLMGVTGVFEIMGGWMVWMAVRGNGNNENGRNKKPWWFAVLGGLSLIVYGFLPTLQPTNSFGRMYAVYGGFFIVLSFLFGWALDGDRPDMGDVVGGSISLVGVLLVLFWPRS